MDVRLHRLRARDFKGLSHLDLEIADLTILVGRNGVGKSSVLDVAVLLRDLQHGVHDAVAERGGFRSIARRTGSSESPEVHLGVEVSIVGVGVGVERHLRYDVVIDEFQRGRVLMREAVRDAATDEMVHMAGDLRYSALASTGDPLLIALSDALRTVTRSAFAPTALRMMAPPDDRAMQDDGRNVTSVWEALAATAGPDREAARAALAAMVGVAALTRAEQGALETLVADIEGVAHPMHELSDGTLLAIASATMLLQPPADGRLPLLTMLDEPEGHLHPGAMDGFVDLARQASASRQVMLATHSPDLLGHVDLRDATIVVVGRDEAGVTAVPMSTQLAAVVEEHHATVGELLRDGYLDQPA